MLKFFAKTAVLVLIILSVYFLINPSACSNFLNGKETNGTSSVPPAAAPGPNEPPATIGPAPADGKTDEMLDQAQPSPAEEKGVFDTNSMHEPRPPQPAYSQEDLDYAKASYYVELEQEYAKSRPLGQDTSREIAFMVMERFKMTQAEWESFLARATAADLFTRVRRDMELTKNKPAEISSPAAVPAE